MNILDHFFAASILLHLVLWKARLQPPRIIQLELLSTSTLLNVQFPQSFLFARILTTSPPFLLHLLFFSPAPSICFLLLLLSSVRRMLSPPKNEGLHQEAGSQVLTGMKRRLDAEMQLHDKASTSSSVADPFIARRP
jgi:hypothetical protein